MVGFVLDIKVLTQQAKGAGALAAYSFDDFSLIFTMIELPTYEMCKRTHPKFLL